MTPPRDPAAGVTLVEMLVALALLAIIGVAGFSMLDQVMRARDRTVDRLDRLAVMQRAMVLVTLDFSTALPRSLAHDPEAGTVGIARQGDAVLRVAYHMADGTLWRAVSGPTGQVLARQPLLAGVRGAEWRFLGPDGAWSGDWPPAGAAQRLDLPPNPRAVDLRLWLDGGDALRRVAVLPDGGP